MSGWTRAEVGVLVRAVCSAPSVHDTNPWVLETHGSSAELYERAERSLPRHDPIGRDRLISCGAALTNLTFAIRSLGWREHVDLFPDRTRPTLVARVSATRHELPSPADLALYRAITRRRSYRHPFAHDAVAVEQRTDLITAGTSEGVSVYTVQPADLRPVAALMTYAASVLRSDRAYQRELGAWSGRYASHRDSDGEERVFVTEPRWDTLPWTGLIRSSTRIPDAPTLTRRLADEVLFAVVTEGDTVLDHVRAGAAAERTWLTAVVSGLVGAVITQPLHLSEVRDGLAYRLGLAGHPQLLLRVGYPAERINARQRDMREHLHHS